MTGAELRPPRSGTFRTALRRSCPETGGSAESCGETSLSTLDVQSHAKSGRPRGASFRPSRIMRAEPGGPAVNASPDNRLRIGVLGAAKIARLFVEGVRASRKVVVTAVASRDVDRASAFARDTGVAMVHPTYEALL